MKLDRYDIAILMELQRNGRISKRELADKIGLSASPCWVRMQKLEELGYILGYNARLDLERIARFCYVTTLVGLETHHADDFTRFENAILDTPEAVHCEAAVGEIDYIVQFLTVDIDHYQRLMEDLLNQDIGIRVYYSHVRSKLIKNNTGQLLEVMLKELANGSRKA